MSSVSSCVVLATVEDLGSSRCLISISRFRNSEPRHTIDKNDRPRRSNVIRQARSPAGRPEEVAQGALQVLQNRKTTPVEMRAVHLFFT